LARAPNRLVVVTTVAVVVVRADAVVRKMLVDVVATEEVL
jgi:hypothetical protein